MPTHQEWIDGKTPQDAQGWSIEGLDSMPVEPLYPDHVITLQAVVAQTAEDTWQMRIALPSGGSITISL